MKKDKQITKVIKGECIMVKYYDPQTDSEDVAKMFVPYRNLPDDEVFRYFKNNCEDLPENAKVLSVVQRIEDRKKWSLPYQEFADRMDAKIEKDDLDTLQNIISALK